MKGQPLCFVLMPFGRKKDPTGGPDIDFDVIYKTAIEPAIAQAGLDPSRADTELCGGVIHKTMFDRLLLCDYAVADLTTANANVFYELGIRHAARPKSTVPIFAANHNIPFDVNLVHSIPYALGDDNAFGAAQAKALRHKLADLLTTLRSNDEEVVPIDSPLFQLVTGYQAPDLRGVETETFHKVTVRSREARLALESARQQKSRAPLDEVRRKRDLLDNAQADVLVDLFLSYRDLSEWEAMIELYDQLPAHVQRVVVTREQYGLALNRAGRREEALEVLNEIVSQYGERSETHGLIGRIYKDRWQEEVEAGRGHRAARHRDRAIEAYLRGFEADFRDYYPGINAATLLDIKGQDESLKKKGEILPVVRYAASQALRKPHPGYWDHATMLEIAVLDDNADDAFVHLEDSLEVMNASWEGETTARNLGLIQDARVQRGQEQAWLQEIRDDLLRVAGKKSSG